MAHSTTERAEFDPVKASEEVWEAFLTAGVFVEAPNSDPFRFASGAAATLKVDAERLLRRPRQLDIVLGHMAAHPCLKEGDVFMYVPTGMRDPAVILAYELQKPLVHAERIPGKGRYDFRFASEEDEDLAWSAFRPRILEDVVTTLGSVAGMAGLLDPTSQAIESLAYLRRGEVNPDHQAGIIDHYLVERNVPFNKDEFRAQLEPWEAELYKPHQKRKDV